MAKVIDLEKVQAAMEKVKANPGMISDVIKAYEKFCENLGIPLTQYEAGYLLMLMSLSGGAQDRFFVGCDFNFGSCKA